MLDRVVDGKAPSKVIAKVNEWMDLHEADLKPYLTGEVFGELLDLEKFTQFGLTGYTIDWTNGADLAPELLHDIGMAA